MSVHNGEGRIFINGQLVGIGRLTHDADSMTAKIGDDITVSPVEEIEQRIEGNEISWSITSPDDRLAYPPRRYALGAVPMSAGTHKPAGPWFIDRDAPLRRTNPDCLITPVFHQQKEITMIEKKNFVTPPVKTPANSLAERHLGSLVTITLPSGAEITDTLEQVHADKGNVFLRLSNVPAEDSTFNILDRCFRLDPKSVVLVRRPKAVRKTAKR